VNRPETIGTAVFVGIFFGLMLGVTGLVIAEIVRYFCKDQRTLATAKGADVPTTMGTQGRPSTMRASDFASTILISIVIGLVVTVVAWFIWQDWFDSTSNSFWLVWAIISVISTPLAYTSVKATTTCPKCKKSFSLADTRQETIERWVKYKNEQVYENGVNYRRDVPYNCHRYWQHTKCDNCGHEYKTEKSEELKA
jgi:rubredoxin